MKPERLNEIEADRLYTIEEAAKTLRFSTKTIQRRIADGTIAAVSAFGRPRIRAEELMRHIHPIQPSAPSSS